MYNALLECTRVWSALDTHNFQEGKIYEVKNGKLIDGHGRSSWCTYTCIEEINDESFYARLKEIEE